MQTHLKPQLAEAMERTRSKTRHAACVSPTQEGSVEKAGRSQQGAHPETFKDGNGQAAKAPRLKATQAPPTPVSRWNRARLLRLRLQR